MNKHRLNLMITMLEEVKAGTWKMTAKTKAIKEFDGIKEKVFDLGNWIEVDGWSDDTHCGFTACAVGHAMVDSRFRKLGLKVMNEQSQVSNKPSFKDFENWEAVQEFFKINRVCATMIFEEDKYPRYLRQAENSKHLITQIIRRIQYLMHFGEEMFQSLNDREKRFILNPALKPYNPR